MALAMAIASLFLAAPQALAADITGPMVSAFDFTPKTVDLTTGEKTVTVSVHVTDPSGVKTPTVALFSDTTDQSLGFSPNNMILTQGTTTDGTWSHTIKVPTTAAPGAWTMTLYPVRDLLGNTTDNGTVTGFFEHTTKLTVINAPADVSGPVVSAFDFTPKTVDLTTGEKTVTVSVHVTDPSGVKTPTVALFSDTTDQSLGFSPNNMILTQGTTTDGTWSHTIKVPTTAAPGAWTMTLYPVRDLLGNTTDNGTVTGFFEHPTKELVGLKSVTPVSVGSPAGLAPQMPASVRLVWSTGTTSEAVTWDPIAATSYAKPGSFIVAGTVRGQRIAQATITVTQPIMRSATVSVSTPAGIAPTMPANISVVWSDKTTTSETVSWSTIAADAYAKAGTFTVSGTVRGEQIARATVTVAAPALVSVVPATVSTLVGLAPKLPANVMVTWSDRSTSSQAVVWDPVPAMSYAQPGTFSVAGTVGGQRVATAIVMVTAPLGEFSPFAGARPEATGRVGEATGDAIADVWGITGTGTLDFFKKTPTDISKVGIRGTNLTHISYLGAITDQNDDNRADLFYRDSRDQSLHFAYNLGNGYLKDGIKVGQNWGGMDQIFYAGQMVSGSPQQYVLARRGSDGSLWRYSLSSKGLSNGTQVGRNWNGMRIMIAPGNMYGDAAWDVVGIRKDGLMYGYRTVDGGLVSVGQIGHGWQSMTNAFVPGDLNGDKRLDLIGQRNDGSMWAYRNTATGFSSMGQFAPSGFSGYRILA
ncbi:Ig-like domain-containing protein [Aestuariimicrobium kwangyangense]|uniref:Ig-like domain-containing protein n=1 Tax=Aestuariimicrobium kwangyangense TaxID=396389 RepID=UPI00146E9DD6|nr:Ig-like domain-containing protein [Aestuariimicrobium kwangyangense]